MLVQLQCTGLNVLYVVAPFITTADDETLRRLRVSLDFLTNGIPDVVRPNVESNGKILNAMMQRSAHLGLLPVLKAIYTIHRRTIEAQRVEKFFRVPTELSMANGFLSNTFDQQDAMRELSLAMRRHRAAFHSDEDSTFMSTTTETFSEEKGEETSSSSQEA